MYLYIDLPGMGWSCTQEWFHAPTRRKFCHLTKTEGDEDAVFTCACVLNDIYMHTHTQTHTHKHTHTQTNKQTNKQASKQASKQTNKQRSKQASKQTSKQASKQASKQPSKQASKQTNKQTNEQTNKQTNKHTHTQTHTHVFRYIYIYTHTPTHIGFHFKMWKHNSWEQVAKQYVSFFSLRLKSLPYACGSKSFTGQNGFSTDNSQRGPLVLKIGMPYAQHSWNQTTYRKTIFFFSQKSRPPWHPLTYPLNMSTYGFFARWLTCCDRLERCNLGQQDCWEGLSFP